MSDLPIWIRNQSYCQYVNCVNDNGNQQIKWVEKYPCRSVVKFTMSRSYLNVTFVRVVLYSFIKTAIFEADDTVYLIIGRLIRSLGRQECLHVIVDFLNCGKRDRFAIWRENLDYGWIHKSVFDPRFPRIRRFLPSFYNLLQKSPGKKTLLDRLS